MNSIIKINWERLGVAASLVCAIHCAIVPLFITSLPLLGLDLVDSPVFEFSMLGTAYIIGFISLRHGYRLHHHKAMPLVLFTLGIGTLGVKEFVAGRPLWLVFPAVALILAAHYFNHRLCQKANHCHSTDCNH
jgi:hypothetical protein